MQVCNAVSTERTQSQYVNLGNLSVACITRPKNCDNGATITLWIKILGYFSGYEGVITSIDSGSTVGFGIYCRGSEVWLVYQVLLPLMCLTSKLQGFLTKHDS